MHISASWMRSLASITKTLAHTNIPHICHFFYTGRIFENQILHQKKRLKAPKTLKMSLKKSNICIFFHSIWKNLHLTENFYTDMSVVSVTNMRYDTGILWHTLTYSGILWHTLAYSPC